MILSPKEDLIVSSVGWADKAALWVLETKTGKTGRFTVSDAKYLTVFPWKSGFFSVLHSLEGGKVEITAHSFSDPEKVISPISFSANGAVFDGSPKPWNSLPCAYLQFGPSTIRRGSIRQRHRFRPGLENGRFAQRCFKTEMI